MTDFMHAFNLVIGILLRLLIPIAITTVVAWFFFRLDARWQKDSMRKQSSQILSIKVDPSTKCWEVMDCQTGKRGQCPAFGNQEEACWEKFSVGGVLANKCLACIYPKLIRANQEVAA